MIAELYNKVLDWAEARNLIKGSTPYKQGLKLMSEYGELCDAVAKGDFEGIKDGIGDVAVVAIIINAQQGYELDSKLLAEMQTKVRLEGRWTREDCILDLAICCHDLILANGPKDSKSFEELLDCLMDIAHLSNLTLTLCLEHAYDEIKDRKGVMYEGVFIKESDPRYQDVMAEMANSEQK